MASPIWRNPISEFLDENCIVFDDEEEYQEQMDKYKDTINAWLKGDRDDQYILDSYMSYLENSLGIMNMVLIIDYLKKLSVI